MNCNYSLKVFQSRHDIASELVGQFLELAETRKKAGETVTAALSGGKTPSFFFKALANTVENTGSDLSNVKFFWVDERCVPPGDNESNFRQVEELLFSRVSIPEKNIYRIRGEELPEKEAERYSQVLYESVAVRNGFPSFDLILLGVGNDGHTASLFPMSKQLYEREKAVVVSESPENGRKRVTLTLPVICNAEKIIFLVTGAEKREILKILCRHEKEDPLFPASFVKTDKGNIEWYVDSVAWSTWPQDSD